MTPSTVVIVFGTLSVWMMCMLLWNINRKEYFSVLVDTVTLTIFSFVILSALHKLGVF